MKFLAVIYARSNSSRLPGKVLLEFKNMSLLEIIVRRIGVFKKTEVLIATSSEQQDDLIARTAKQLNVNCYRGSLENVVLRTQTLLHKYRPDFFFRINGDSPFVDLSLLETGIQLATSEIDLVTNVFPNRTFPYGVALELIRTEAFLQSYMNASNYNVEHITKQIYSSFPEERIASVSCVDKKKSKFRLVVDTESDAKTLERIYETVDPLTGTYIDAINFLERNELST